MADPKQDPYAEFGGQAAENDPYAEFNGGSSSTPAHATMEQAKNASVNTLSPEQTQALQSHSGAASYSMGEFGKGLVDTAKGLGSMLDPRTHGAGEQAAQALGPAGPAALRMGRGLVDLGKQAMEVPGAIRDLSQNNDPMLHLGMAAPRAGGQAAGQLGAALAPKMLGKIGGAINEATAPPEPNAGITEGLHVPTKSPKMAQAVTDVEGARPHLEGVQSQAELQQRLPAAKQQVWDPYQKAVDSIKTRPVQGPDGPTTVGDLEAERLKVSAERQAVRKIRPTDQQSAIQAQKAQADLNARYKTITDALDTELKTTGIDPRAIREVHGNLKGVERNVSGKSTVTEKLQPYGVRKMVPHGLPRIFGGEGMEWAPLQGVRDIRSGQSGMLKPTDVGIERTFKPKK